MIGKPWKTIPCIEPGCTKSIHVNVVDEDEIEESGANPDFVEGDNWIHDGKQTDYPQYIPDHHIILSSLIFQDPVKVDKTLAHELAEIVAMASGIPYEQAHELVANPVETAEAKAARIKSLHRLPWGG